MSYPATLPLDAFQLKLIELDVWLVEARPVGTLGVLPDALSATVEAVMDVEAGDVSPAASKAFTVYVYVVPAARPVSV